MSNHFKNATTIARGLTARLPSHFGKIAPPSPTMARVQIKALSLQLPFTYLILSIGAWSLVHNRIGIDPNWLALWIPIAFTAYAAIKSVKCLSWREKAIDDDTVLRLHHSLNTTMKITVTALAAWILTLFFLGDDHQKAHVAFHLAVTVMIYTYPLSSLPQSTKYVMGLITACFLTFCAFLQGTYLPLVALHAILVCLGTFIMLNLSHQVLSEAVREKSKSEKLMKVDGLTGLPNRMAFYEMLEGEIERDLLERHNMAIGILDLDGFKPVNDLYGHVVGDRMLAAMANRLQTEGSRMGDVRFHRVGGDEFAFVAVGDGDPDFLAAVGDGLCEIAARPFVIGELNLGVTATVGIAKMEPGIRSATELVERADHMLYEGKRLGRARCHVYSSEREGDLHRKAMIAVALKSDRLEEEIRPVFQPIIDITNGTVSAMEALARWENHKLGEIRPTEFIEIAEKTGQIGRLTCAMFSKTLGEATTWEKSPRLSFNLSAHDISSKSVLDKLVSIMLDSGFPPERISFEITETALAEDVTQAKQALETLRSMGCSLSLDDFGTGYSNLSRLHSLNLTAVKLDRSLVSGIENRVHNRAMVESMLFYMEKRHLECIAEGVETKTELKALKELGVKYAQGYYFSRPMEASVARKILDAPDATSIVS